MQALQIDQLVTFDQVLTPLLKLLASPLGIVMCILLAVFVAIKCKDLLQRPLKAVSQTDTKSCREEIADALERIGEKRKKDRYRNTSFIAGKMLDDGWFTEKFDGGYIMFDGWEEEFEHRMSGDYNYEWQPETKDIEISGHRLSDEMESESPNAYLNRIFENAERRAEMRK